jgi:hypothetical protein
MKKLIAKIWRSVKNAYERLTSKAEELIPIAIKIVEGVKKVMDSKVDDVILSIVKDAIPGDADDILIDKITSVVEKWLPKILLELTLTQAIIGIENKNEQLQAILERLKLSSDEAQGIFYHGLCSLIIEKLSDGKIEWSEAVVISEYYYKNKIEIN